MRPLTAAEKTLLPTDEDVAFYRAHGWWISPRIIPDATIDAAVEAADRYYAGERDAVPHEGLRDYGWKPEHGDVLRKDDYSSLRMRGLADLVASPLIAACAARLTGSPSLRLWHDQLLWKPIDRPDLPRKANVGWHTDRGYWKTCTSSAMLTAWAPFHDIGEEHGTVAMMDGSHRWGEHRGELDFFNPDLAKQEGHFDALRGALPKRRVPMVMRRGQVSFHSCLTVHGSGPNRSAAPRRSMAIHLQDEANRYRRHELPTGRIAEHFNDTLCRKVDGAPDYTDPVICPTLWRAETAAAVGWIQPAGAAS